MLSEPVESGTVTGVPPAKRVPPDKPEKQIQVNFRLPPELVQRIEAAAGVFGRPRERILAEAVTAWLNGLPAHDRQLIDAVLARRQKP